jgi:hypothetical protein
MSSVPQEKRPRLPIEHPLAVDEEPDVEVGKPVPPSGTGPGFTHLPVVTSQ